MRKRFWEGEGKLAVQWQMLATLLPEATRKIKNNPTGQDALDDIQQGIEGATWLLLTAYSKVWEKRKKKKGKR